jgi:hypothetical protein
MKIQNKKTKTYLVVGLALVAMLASSSSLSAVFAQVTTPNTVFSAQEDEIPTEISQAASQMPQHSKDVTFLNMEKRVHGFSGAYVDENGILNVYTTDPSIKSIDKSTLADYVEPYHFANGIIVKHSDHSWHKWIELGNIAKPLFTMNLGVNVMGVDDKNQVYRIGFEKLNSSNTADVDKFLTDHNIPLDMVQLVEVGKIIPVNSGITVKPIKGGAEIGIPGAENQGGWGPTPACTAGFIVKDSSGNYRGLTAEHCQASQNWNNGQQYYTQPYGGRTIGNEKASSGTHTHSDSLLFSTSETGGYAKIFQYGGGNALTVTAKSSYEPVGDAVCSVGEGSASTRCGTITYTGQTLYDSGLGFNLSDQVITNFGSKPGDSGSPVWHAYQGNGISAYGLVWGISGTSTTYYSPVWDIDTDLGTTLTYN